MKILLIGEASFLHNTLKKGLVERGHRVTTMSDGNGWHDAPRDIDLRRDGRWGKLGGLWVVWQLLRHLPQLCGNDVVQIHNYQFVPLMYRWNTLLLRFLKLTNRCVVKGCFGDDPQIFRRQAQGVPAYSDTFWSGQLQNTDQHRDRIAEVVEHGAEASWRKTTAMADALVPCLYEYWLDYNEPPYAAKLHYIPLPIECEGMVRWCDGEMVTLHSSTPQHHNTTTSIMALLFGCGVMMMIAGNMEVVTRNIRYSWSLVFYVMAGVELFLWLWHTIFLPGGTHGYAKPKPTMGLHRGEFRISLRRMLKRKDDITALTFFVLFLLPDTLLALTAPLFIIAKPHNGGLGLSPQEFAFTQGTIAIIAIALGYTLGGKAIKKHGLRRWLLPSALLLAVPGAALLFLSYNTAAPLSIVAASLAAGHAALGFALSMVKQVVVRFTRNMPDNTLRHAIARTLIATPFVIVGSLASLMLTIADYQRIFQLATELAVVPLIVSVFHLYLTRRQPQAE